MGPQLAALGVAPTAARLATARIAGRSYSCRSFDSREGNYDPLVTQRLRQLLDRQSVLKSAVDALEETLAT
jgi:hypothetical protein